MDSFYGFDADNINGDIVITLDSLPLHEEPLESIVDNTARLIAAAPELLEALERIHKCIMSGESIPGSWITQSANAIAKARGEA